MKKILLIIMVVGVAPNLFADSYNSISVQGQLNPAAPIYRVTVDILSGGQVVGSGSNVDLIPDSNGIFSTNTIIADPKIFLTGSDFVMRLSTGTSPITVLSTFSVTAAPFALTIRGDAQNNNQNVFGAYGNVGIGTDAPAYRLVVSSAGSNLMWVSSDGVHATKYYGDGSNLTGVTGTGDNLGNHIATTTLNMGNNAIENAYVVRANAGLFVGANGSNLAVVDGKVGIGTTQPRSAFEVAGLIAIDTGTFSIAIGPDTGYVNAQRDVFIGKWAGSGASGGNNVSVGYMAGGSTSGYENVFVGSAAGVQNTTGRLNTVIGAGSGAQGIGIGNTILGWNANFSGPAGDYNTFLGVQSGYNNTGGGNIFIGDTVGFSNTIGGKNILIGDQVDTENPTDSYMLNIGDTLYGNLAYGNIGIGAPAPQYRLVVAGEVGESGNLLVVSTGTSNVIRMTGAGEIYANKFVGDGSGLTGLAVAGDNLGDHTATRALDMAGYQIMGVSSITVTGMGSTGYSLSLSSGIYTPAGTVTAGWFVGNGSGLTGLPSSGDVYKTSTQTFTGQNTFSNQVTMSSNAYVNGNFGVGTLNPLYKMEIANGSVKIKNALDVPALNLDGASGVTIGDIRFLRDDVLKSIVRMSNDTVGASWSFIDQANGTIPLTIQSGGNVGVGTASPTKKLEVVGDAKISGGLSIGGNTYVSAYRSADIAFSPGIAGNVYNAEEFDNLNEFDAPTGTFVAANAGVYVISAYVTSRTTIPNANRLIVYILKNGNFYKGYQNSVSGSLNPSSGLSLSIKLAANDTISVTAVSDTAWTLAGLAEWTHLTIARIQ